MPRKRLDITPTQAFWTFCGLMLACSAFFALSVEAQRHARAGRGSVGATLAPGEAVEFIEVIDGDEITVQRGADVFTLRLQGIKCFNATVSDAEMRAFGAACEAALGRMARRGDLHVEFERFRRDRVGRVLGYLTAGADDVGEWLVREGHAVVYTKYPFDRAPRYLSAEQAAKTRGIGVWGSPVLRERIRALKREWAQERAE